VNLGIGVVNDGPGSPAPAPPSASVKEADSVISIWDVTTGEALADVSSIPVRVVPSRPFGDGCYRFAASVTVMRTYRFQPDHSYDIDVRASFDVTRYVRAPNDEIVAGTTPTLAWGIGSEVHCP
jgi:hypothetical protein